MLKEYSSSQLRSLSEALTDELFINESIDGIMHKLNLEGFVLNAIDCYSRSSMCLLSGTETRILGYFSRITLHSSEFPLLLFRRKDGPAS